MVYTRERVSLAIQEHHGEGILGRFASEDFGGVRPGVREPAGVGGTVLRELCLGAEESSARLEEPPGALIRNDRDMIGPLEWSNR